MIIEQYFPYVQKNKGHAHVSQCLRDGGVVLHPSDTCYGLACSIYAPNAIERIYNLKERSLHKPSSILVSDVPMLLRYAKPSRQALQMIKQHGPCRATYLLPLKSAVPHDALHKEGSISIRIPKQLELRRIIQSLGHPILTTSANIAGASESYTEHDIYSLLARSTYHPDLILLAGSLQKIPPSTIIDLRGNTPVIIREGSFTIEL